MGLTPSPFLTCSESAFGETPQQLHLRPEKRKYSDLQQNFEDGEFEAYPCALCQRFPADIKVTRQNRGRQVHVS